MYKTPGSRYISRDQDGRSDHTKRKNYSHQDVRSFYSSNERYPTNYHRNFPPLNETHTERALDPVSRGGEGYLEETSHITAHEQVPTHRTGMQLIQTDIVTNEAATTAENITIVRIHVGLITG